MVADAKNAINCWTLCCSQRAILLLHVCVLNAWDCVLLCWSINIVYEIKLNEIRAYNRKFVSRIQQKLPFSSRMNHNKRFPYYFQSNRTDRHLKHENFISLSIGISFIESTIFTIGCKNRQRVIEIERVRMNVGMGPTHSYRISNVRKRWKWIFRDKLIPYLMRFCICILNTQIYCVPGTWPNTCDVSRRKQIGYRALMPHTNMHTQNVCVLHTKSHVVKSQTNKNIRMTFARAIYTDATTHSEEETPRRERKKSQTN